jgi:ribosomal protein L11 methyltransferase
VKFIPDQWLKYRFQKGNYDHELLITLLDEINCLGVIEQNESFEAFFNISEIERISKEIRKITLSISEQPIHYDKEIIANEDWHLSWQKYFKPIRLTPNIALFPHWENYKGPEKIQIAIKPGMAFGTGTHATTQMALKLMEKHLKPGMSVLDAGCGNGILTIAALKMGAGYVQSWDIDPMITENFREHMELNNIHDRYTLTIDDVTKQPAFSVDLIISNIERKPNLALLASLHRQGSVPPTIFTGILKEEYDMFVENVLNYGLILDDEMKQDEWVAFFIK